MSIVPVVGGRTFEAILRYLAEQVALSSGQVTDFNPLSVLRTLGEMQALLGERWEEELAASVAEGIDRATYRSFGFNQTPATRAYGVVLFERTDTALAQTIPAGTAVSVPQTTRRYATTADALLDVGDTGAAVTVIADGAGSIWNTNAGTISAIDTPVPGAALTVANPRDFITGGDEETDEDRRLRFERYIRSIHRATADAVSYGARSAQLADDNGIPLEVVASAQTIDAPTAGAAIVYVWNGVETSPAQPAVSATLQAKAQQIINGYTDQAGVKVPGYKAAGATVSVIPATIRAVPVTVAVYPAPGWSLAMVEQGVRVAIAGVFDRFNVGDTPLRVSDLRNAVGAVRGVVDHEFAAPAPLPPPLLPLNPLPAPPLSVQALTSTFTAGTYRVAYAVLDNATGIESPRSVQASLSVTGTTQSIRIDPMYALPLPASAVIRVYLSQVGAQATDPMYRQVATLTADASGNTATLTLTAPPDTSTAQANATVGPSALPVTAVGGVGDPTTFTAPSVGAGASTLAIGSYWFTITYATSSGETRSAPPVAVVLGSTNLRITLAALSGLPALTTTVYAYLSAVGALSTDPVRLAGSAPVNAGTMTGTVVISAPPASNNATPPTSNQSAPASTAPGRIVAGNYYVGYAWRTGGGTTPIGPLHVRPVRAVGSQDIQVGSLAAILPNDPNTNPPTPCTVGYYLSIAPGSTTLAYVGGDSGAGLRIAALPTDPTQIAPTANTSANVGGADGVIIVPGAVVILQGT